MMSVYLAQEKNTKERPRERKAWVEKNNTKQIEYDMWRVCVFFFCFLLLV